MPGFLRALFRRSDRHSGSSQAKEVRESIVTSVRPFAAWALPVLIVGDIGDAKNASEPTSTVSSASTHAQRGPTKESQLTHRFEHCATRRRDTDTLHPDRFESATDEERLLTVYNAGSGLCTSYDEVLSMPGEEGVCEDRHATGRRSEIRASPSPSEHSRLSHSSNSTP